MRRRKRYVVRLLWLLFLLGESYAQDNSNRSVSQPGKQATPSAPVAIQQEQTATDYYKVSCDRPKDHDAADLCEQRRMAQAAEDSVWWARVQALLGALGFGGILITLIFTGLGTKAAARQVRLSRHALIHTDRAFVYPLQVVWAARKDYKSDQVRSWQMSIRWKNSGNTPTRHLRMHTNMSVRPDELPNDFDFPDFGSGDVLTFIAPQNTADTMRLELSLDDLEEIIAGNRQLYTWGWAEYDDVFERTPRHRTEFCYKWNIGGNPRDPDKVTFGWTTHDRYNGADEECETPLKTASPKDMGDR